MMVIGSFMVMVPRKYKRSQGLGLERVHLSPANDFNPAFLMAMVLKSAVKKKGSIRGPGRPDYILISRVMP